MSRILVPGRNCERISEVTSAGMLVDARDYYLALHAALSRAERFVLIAGWQFDSGVALARGRDREALQGPVYLLELLEHIVALRPELTIHVLAWDYSLVFALEREWMQRLRFDWMTDERIHFVFDNQHPLGASHHQKLVVVDGVIAFSGGVDICESRWDDREHALHNPDRVNRDGSAQKPYHDVMAYCTGPAVRDVERLFCQRWKRATGELLELPTCNDDDGQAAVDVGDLGVHGRALPISCESVAISLTFAEHAPVGTPKVEQIKALYEDAIAVAQRLIYIESQYFTSRSVHDALCRRMKADRPKLDIVILLPLGADTPKESFALGAVQREVLDSLQSVAREQGHALRVLRSAEQAASGALVPTFIHSKVLIVDDRLLSVGSANCTNRSMSFDSELNFTWECTGDEDALSKSIAHARASLICEHAGIQYDASFEQAYGLVARIDALIGASKLHAREPSAATSPSSSFEHALEQAFDPDRALTELELDDLLDARRV